MGLKHYHLASKKCSPEVRSRSPYAIPIQAINRCLMASVWWDSDLRVSSLGLILASAGACDMPACRAKSEDASSGGLASHLAHPIGHLLAMICKYCIDEVIQGLELSLIKQGKRTCFRRSLTHTIPHSGVPLMSAKGLADSRCLKLPPQATTYLQRRRTVR